MDKTKLKARIDEELKDVETYKQMAEECSDWEQIFCDIAHEESEHATMLQHIYDRIA